MVELGRGSGSTQKNTRSQNFQTGKKDLSLGAAKRGRKERTVYSALGMGDGAEKH